MPTDHDPFAPYEGTEGEQETKVDAPAVTENEQVVATDTDESTVPVGSSAEVMTWVGEDHERAQMALDHERASHQPRKGLTARLEEMLAK